jgi:hypothetical protein
MDAIFGKLLLCVLDNHMHDEPSLLGEAPRSGSCCCRE